MKVVLQENDQPTKEVSDDTDSVQPDSDVPDGIPMPPPLFNRQRSPLDGTPWQHDAHAQQLLDRMPKPSKPMIGLPWKKVERLRGAISIILSSSEVFLFSYVFWSLITVRILFLPPANEVWGKVMFLHLSVILFKGWGQVVYTLGRHAPDRHHSLGRHPPGQTPPWPDNPQTDTP